MLKLEQRSKTVEWWQRVEELFVAFQHRPRHEWHRGLSEACADDAELAYEVLSLLVAAESVDRAQGE